MKDLPTYQELMLPVLEFYQDGQPQRFRDAVEYICSSLDLSQELQTKKSSSGTLVINTRTSWAHTYLKQAGLLESVSRGVNKITPVGQKALSDKPSEINKKYLEQFKSFQDFINSSKQDSSDSRDNQTDKQPEDLTPSERIAQAIKEQNSALRQEVLEHLRNVDPYYFEKIIADLLEIMGYGIAEVTQRSNDGGIDAIVNEDKLGLSKIYAQAKRYADNNRINRKELQNFIGALDINAVTKGVFITTSSFYPQAKEELKWTQKNIVLVDGNQLTQLMIDYGLGVSTEQTYKIKRIDSDYFEVE